MNFRSAAADVVVPLRPLLIGQTVIAIVAAAGIALLDVKVATQGVSALHGVAFGALAAVATLALVCALSNCGTALQAAIRQQSRILLRFASSYSFGGLVALSVLAGFGEELLFRALIQGGLEGYLGSTLAVLVASILFGLAHCLSRTYFVMATVMGLLLGFGYVLSESLLLVMAWHGIYDLAALIVLARFPHLLGVGDKATPRSPL
jgi:hypothetical protein